MLGFQVHHIFPEAMMGDFEKTFKDMGINISANDYSNRINLFDNDKMAKVMKEFHTKNPDDMNVARFFGSVRHSGGHKTYNSFVQEKLETILALTQADGKTPLDNEVKKAMVLDLHQQLVIAMREGSISLYNDNLTTEQTLQNYDKVFATRLAKPQDFMDSDGKGVIVFDGKQLPRVFKANQYLCAI